MATLPKIIREMESTLGPRVRKAYLLSERVHRGARRKSGEPYITHPIAVAKILYDAGGDSDIICAALLHDTVEESPNSVDVTGTIYTDFGDHILFLVEAMSKDETIADKTDQQAAYIEQIQRAFALDIFAFLIKIADLIHNMSTISSLPKKRREPWLQELRYEYLPLFSEYFHRVPLAHREVYQKLMEAAENVLQSYEMDSQPRKS